MVPRCVPATALTVLFGCGLAAPAWAQGDALVAQIAQAQATPTPPPLTEQPDLEEQPQPAPEPTAEPAPEETPVAAPVPELPDTGAEPAFLALAGLGLLAAGAGLRRTADDLVRA